MFEQKCETLENPFRGKGLPDPQGERIFPSTDAEAVTELMAQCMPHRETPLRTLTEQAEALGVAQLFLKDERPRMGLGSFKALGAAYAIAYRAAETLGSKDQCTADDWKQALAGQCFITASAGNHGLSVAMGAGLFGAKAVVVLADTVPEGFAARLRDMGAEVVRAGADYEASMAAAEAMAGENDWSLLSDSSWPGYTEAGYRVMEGYTKLAAETVHEMQGPPTHILLQAGVGGMAAAVAAYARRAWGDAPQIVVVEPVAAPALIEGIRAGHVVDTSGPVSAMGRLDCKTASMIALNGLARDADRFVTITEEEGAAAVAALAKQGLATTPSGAAGFAALLAGRVDCGPDARVLCILSEGGEDGEGNEQDRD